MVPKHSGVKNKVASQQPSKDQASIHINAVAEQIPEKPDANENLNQEKKHKHDGSEKK